MPAPRSKRKRSTTGTGVAAAAADNDPSGTARRRQRESLLGTEPPNPTKNEEPQPTKSEAALSAAPVDDTKASASMETSKQVIDKPSAASEKPKETSETGQSSSHEDVPQVLPKQQQASTATIEPAQERTESKTEPQNGGEPQAPVVQATTTAATVTAAVPRTATATTNAVAVAATTLSPAPPAGESRESRIRGRLEHRKVLLERVRQTRAAAKSQLVLVSAGASPTAPMPGMEEEIIAFRNMTREVVSLARKQARIDSEAPGEKRTSVSLRRGSSVGKRMNAALSSLAPGERTSASVEEVTSQVMQSAVNPAAAAQRPAGGTQMSAPAATAARATGAGMPAVAHAALKAPPSMVANRVTTSHKAPKMASNNAGPRGMSSSSSAPSAKPPLHAGLSGSGLPPNRLAQPSVVCPEAMALRERRKSIRQKLAVIMNERQTQIERKSRDSLGSEADARSASASPQRQTRAKLTAMVVGPGRAPHLPRRRKTQWDYLLEEMRWTATDFIEERKWKESTARTLGQAIILPKDTLAPSTNDEEMEDVSDSETKSNCAKDGSENEETPHRRLYIDVSVEHEQLARKVAKIVSSMVSELSGSVIDNGAFAESDEEYTKALRRHEETRKRLEGNESQTASDKAENIGMPADEAKENTEEEKPRQVASDKATDHLERERIFNDISGLVENLLAKAKKPAAKSKNTPTIAKAPGIPVSLSTAETAAVNSIEDNWARLQAGAVVSGPFAAGKTIAACTLLWKHRLDGPQLLICSPASMIRWMHELGRFDGIRRRSVGLTGGIGNPVHSVRGTKEAFKVGDVVLCEYSAVPDISRSDLDAFLSIVVDCRFPKGFLGSRPFVPAQDAGRHSQEITDIPKELISAPWWELLACVVSSHQTNRLLIDDLDIGESLRLIESLPDRQLLEVVALRGAFVIGSATFKSRHSTQKLLLAWARKRIKDSKEEGSKFERVKKLFVSLIEPFSCCIEGATLLEELKPSRPNTALWDVRKCEMPSHQRSAYERTCMELRSALSLNLNLDRNGGSSLSQTDPFRKVSSALLRLRRQCFHSNMDTMLSDSRVCTRLGWSTVGGSHLCVDTKLGSFPRKPLDSSSQPDLELASQILEGSSKMAELVSILSLECQCDFEGEHVLKTVLPIENKKSQGKGKNKRSAARSTRVVILAAMPETQILVSVLLNSIGVEHELLLRPTSSSMDVDAATRDAQLGSLAWSECQLILSKFNDDTKGAEDETRIIIASPQTAAGDHGGLGIELADTIISLDEDWSGRGELLLKAVISRCRARRASSKDKGHRLIKLVAAKSCEEVFLSADNKGDARRRPGRVSMDALTWPCNPFGLFLAPVTSGKTGADTLLHSRQPSPEAFAFTGSNIFECSGRALGDVLSTESELPPLLTTSSDLLFLPNADEDLPIEVQLNVIKRLVEGEESASPLVSGSVVGGLATPRLVAVLPPVPTDFPKGVVSRHDLGFLSTRVHLYRFGMTFDLQGASLVLPVELGGNGAVVASDDVDLAEPWQKPSGKPTEVASSLLFYDNLKASPELSSAEDVALDSLVASPQRRVNAYSSSFSCALAEGALRDGNQGSEGLVYFPPLFPRMMESSMLASNDVASRQARRMVSSEVVVEGTTPKHHADPLSAVDAKRPRLEPADNVGAGLPGADILKVPERPTLESRVITEDEASHGDAASVLLDLSDDYGLAGIGAVPLPRDSALAAAHSFVENRSSGMYGNRPGNEWLSLRAPCDAEEAELSGLPDATGVELGSMILFVSKKRPRGFTGLPGASSLLHRPQQAARQWPGAPSGALLSGGGNPAFHDVNGVMSGKKMKKNQKEALVASSAFSRLPIADQLAGVRPGGHMAGVMPYSKTKDGFRHRLLVSTRQTGIGNTLFEAPAFRYAAVRVRKRVADRLARHCWTSSTAFELGPGLPLLVSKQDASSPGFRGIFEADPRLWTSIVKRLKHKDSVTGDEASHLAVAQRAALHRSLVAPCRVDFGPFQSGFLASPTGMTALSAPRSKIGVTLPMGVKVPLSQKDMHQISWSKSEDANLQRCTVRFGLNWILASRVLSGFQDIVVFSQRDEGRPTFPRAARSCRDRWQSLARIQPLLAKEVRQSEHLELESSTMTLDQILQGSHKLNGAAAPPVPGGGVPTDKNPAEFLLPGSDKATAFKEKAKDGDAKSGDVMEVEPAASPVAKPKRSFAAFAAAKAKKQAIPMTIPGVVTGSPPTVVPSHPSHMQSVQASVAASWSNGRTEMWPLQLLDAADRQRAAAAAATSAATAAVPTTTKARPSSGSSSRAHGSSSSTSGKGSRAPSSASATVSSRRAGTSAGPSQRPTSSSVAPPPSASARGAASRPQNRTTASMQNFAPPPKATPKVAAKPVSSKSVSKSATPPKKPPPKSDKGGTGKSPPKK